MDPTSLREADEENVVNEVYPIPFTLRMFGIDITNPLLISTRLY